MNIEEIVKTIEGEFKDGHIRQVSWREVIIKLEEKGFQRDDIDDALDEAQREKIIMIDSGFLKWINPDIREVEKAKTQKYFHILAEIFKQGEIDFLPRENLKAELKKSGFNDEEVKIVITEAARDYVLDFHTRGYGPDYNLVAGCSWIPPEDRERFASAEKASKKSSEKWVEKKIAQEDF